MGRSHLLISAATWLLAAPPLAATAGRSLSGVTLAASTAVCAAAALGPDLDHPQATLARTFGPLTAAVARMVAVVSGGHRRGTHSLLAAVVIGAASTLLAGLPRDVAGWRLPVNWGGWALLGFCAYTLTLTLGMTVWRARLLGDLVHLVQAVALTAVVVLTVPGTWWWMPVAITTGWLLHCLQDAFTGGCPQFWWPLGGGALRLARLRTGGVVEMVLAAAAGVTVGWCSVLGSPLG